MDWKQLLTPKRFGRTEPEDIQWNRTCFQKDYDRLVFSSHFRRLKDKTQVFSLSNNDYIRTRLIHSLEVSCVGRSLGRIIGEEIVQRHQLSTYGFSASDFGDIVAAACLAHDIGNPPFGHAGEEAIRIKFDSWYSENENPVEDLLNKSQRTDFNLYEGNAQGFRILTRLEMPYRNGGMQLTCPTLAAFMKYPRESYISPDILNNYQNHSSACSIKKYGFFQAEKELFAEVAKTVGLIRRHDNAYWWCRHPLAFLMEAADDICYLIVDIEDAYRMGYIPFDKAEYLLQSIAKIDISQLNQPETIKRLRAKSIDKLVRETAEIFLDSENEILSGKFDRDLLSLSQYAQHLETIIQTITSTVFEHRDILSIRIAGYEVLGRLFVEFADSVVNTTKKGQLVRHLLPQRYFPRPEETTYQRLLRVTDYISGMTDSYATNLFQKLSGISLG